MNAEDALHPTTSVGRVPNYLAPKLSFSRLSEHLDLEERLHDARSKSSQLLFNIRTGGGKQAPQALLKRYEEALKEVKQAEQALTNSRDTLTLRTNTRHVSHTRLSSRSRNLLKHTLECMNPEANSSASTSMQLMLSSFRILNAGEEVPEGARVLESAQGFDTSEDQIKVIYVPLSKEASKTAIAFWKNCNVSDVSTYLSDDSMVAHVQLLYQAMKENAPTPSSTHEELREFIRARQAHWPQGSMDMLEPYWDDLQKLNQFVNHMAARASTVMAHYIDGGTRHAAYDHASSGYAPDNASDELKDLVLHVHENGPHAVLNHCVDHYVYLAPDGELSEGYLRSVRKVSRESQEQAGETVNHGLRELIVDVLHTVQNSMAQNPNLHFLLKDPRLVHAMDQRVTRGTRQATKEEIEQIILEWCEMIEPLIRDALFRSGFRHLLGIGADWDEETMRVWWEDMLKTRSANSENGRRGGDIRLFVVGIRDLIHTSLKQRSRRGGFEMLRENRFKLADEVDPVLFEVYHLVMWAFTSDKAFQVVRQCIASSDFGMEQADAGSSQQVKDWFSCLFQVIAAPTLHGQKMLSKGLFANDAVLGDLDGVKACPKGLQQLLLLQCAIKQACDVMTHIGINPADYPVQAKEFKDDNADAIGPRSDLVSTFPKLFAGLFAMHLIQFDVQHTRLAEACMITGGKRRAVSTLDHAYISKYFQSIDATWTPSQAFQKTEGSGNTANLRLVAENHPSPLGGDYAIDLPGYVPLEDCFELPPSDGPGWEIPRVTFRAKEFLDSFLKQQHRMAGFLAFAIGTDWTFKPPNEPLVELPENFDEPNDGAAGGGGVADAGRQDEEEGSEEALPPPKKRIRAGKGAMADGATQEETAEAGNGETGGDDARDETEEDYSDSPSAAVAAATFGIYGPGKRPRRGREEEVQADAPAAKKRTYNPKLASHLAAQQEQVEQGEVQDLIQWQRDALSLLNTLEHHISSAELIQQIKDLMRRASVKETEAPIDAFPLHYNDPAPIYGLLTPYEGPVKVLQQWQAQGNDILPLLGMSPEEAAIGNSIRTAIAEEENRTYLRELAKDLQDVDDELINQFDDRCYMRELKKAYANGVFDENDV